MNQLLDRSRDPIFSLCQKMIWQPLEAEDAAQEILLKLALNLQKFKGDSSLWTWAYRIACNHIYDQNAKHRKAQDNFADFSTRLREDKHLPYERGQTEAEQRLLVEEAKLGCANAMLQCLDLEDRMVYVLGEILMVSSKEGAEITGLSSANFRQRLSRSRKRLLTFLTGNCGVVAASNACRCSHRLGGAVAAGHIDPQRLLFAGRTADQALMERIEQLSDDISYQELNPPLSAPAALMERVREAIALAG